MAQDEATPEGRRLIAAWLNASDRVARTNEAYKTALREAAEAEEKLAKWLLPSDAKLGERIGVWHGDSIFTACKTMFEGKDVFAVEVRKRGRDFSLLKIG